MEKWSSINTGLFQFLTNSEQEFFLQKLQKRTLEAGESLFVVGDQATCLYFVESGQFAVKTFTGFEGKMQVVALLDEGTVVGESGVFDGAERSASLVAVKASSVLELRKDTYDEIKAAHPAIAVKILEHTLKLSSLRLGACTKRLVHIL